ncbi:hypothetical protein Hanom_Chr06g00550731 [Helianthus anomalus]
MWRLEIWLEVWVAEKKERMTKALNVDNAQGIGDEEISVNTDVPAFSSRFDRSVLARVRDFNVLVSIKRLVSSAGIFDVVFHYVDGFNLLLVFKDKNSAADFIGLDIVWKEWFSHADLWVGQAYAFERVAWLRVHGIPLHLFCEEVVHDICKRYGSVAKPPQISEDVGDLSMVCVGVLVGEGKRFLEELVLNWNGKRYRVWVSEELGDWTPNYLEEDGDSEDSDDELSVVGSEFQSPKLQVDPSDRPDDDTSVSGRHEEVQPMRGVAEVAHVQINSSGNNDGSTTMHEVDGGVFEKNGNEFNPIHCPGKKSFVGTNSLGGAELGGDTSVDFKVGNFDKKKHGVRRPTLPDHLRIGKPIGSSPEIKRPNKRPRHSEEDVFCYPFPDPKNDNIRNGCFIWYASGGFSNGSRYDQL